MTRWSDLFLVAGVTDRSLSSIADVPARVGRGFRRARAVRRSRSAAPAPAGDDLIALLVRPLEGRTGSTMLMALLGTSDQIAFDRTYPYEFRFLTYLARMVDTMALPPQSVAGWDQGVLLEGPPHLIGPLPFRSEIVDVRRLQLGAARHLWAAFSESVRAASGDRGVRMYAEKAWGDGPTLFGSSGVETRSLNLVRDPRDIVASVHAFDARRGFAGFGRRPNQTDEEYLVELVASMARNYREMEAAASTGDAIWVRYEDLVADGVRAAARISAWLDLPLDPSVLAPRGAQYRRHSTTPRPEASVGRWRDDLSPSQVGLIERQLGDVIRMFGYGG